MGRRAFNYVGVERSEIYIFNTFMNKIGALLMEIIDTIINLRRVIIADLLVLINTGAKVTCIVEINKKRRYDVIHVATLSRQ